MAAVAELVLERWEEPFEDKSARKRWCRWARQRAGISAGAVAEALDVGEAVVRQWESARVPTAPNAHRLRQFAHRTGCPLPTQWRLENLRPEQRDRRRSRSGPVPSQRSATSVADEILAIGERLGGLGGSAANIPRNAKIFAQRYGVAGANVSTLQACGDHYGMTRERVRQIQQKMVERAGQFGVQLDGTRTRELAVAIAGLPAGPLAEAEERLRPLLGSNLSLLDARRFANEVLAVSLPFLVMPVQVMRPVGAESQLFVPGARPLYVEEAVSQAKRLIRHCGAANVALTWALTQEACPTEHIDREQLRGVLRTLPGFGWLDDREAWFWFGPEASSNRIVGRVVEILAAAGDFVDVDEIYAGLVRYNRDRQPQASEFAGVIAPIGVVTRLLRASPEFVSRQSDDFKLAEDIPVESVLCEATLEVYRYMDARGGLASRNELVQRFVREGSMNPVTLSVALAISPAIRYVDRGIFAIRGRPLSGPRLEEAARMVGVPLGADAEPQPSGVGRGAVAVRYVGAGALEWDWTLTDGAVRNRMAHVPSAAQRFAREGDYALPDGGHLTIASGRPDLLRGLVGAAIRSGFVPGDRLCVRLDAVAMRAELSRAAAPAPSAEG